MYHSKERTCLNPFNGQKSSTISPLNTPSIHSLHYSPLSYQDYIQFGSTHFFKRNFLRAASSENFLIFHTSSVLKFLNDFLNKTDKFDGPSTPYHVPHTLYLVTYHIASLLILIYSSLERMAGVRGLFS